MRFMLTTEAGLKLRQAEQKYIRKAAVTNDNDAEEKTPPLTEGSLVFKEHLERLSEVVLVVLIGGTLFWDSWSLQAVALTAFVFIVARPAAVFMSLLGSGEKASARNLSGWFGVRGIGSLYYLMFAITHGLPESTSLLLIHYTLVVVAISIVIHGISVKPLLNRFWRNS